MLQSWRRRYRRPNALAPTASDTLTPMTVVTGGSDGIGYALAARIAIAGEPVLLVARTLDTLARAAIEIKSASGGVVETLSLDITLPNAAATIAARLAARDAYCDVLINAAGIGLAGEFSSHAPERLDQLVAVNISALTALTRFFLPAMLRRGRGGILNVASLGAYAPGPYQAAYYASKSYVLALTEAIAHEHAGRGVRIAVLAPGPVRTAFHARMGGATGLYLKLLPVPSADQIAKAAIWRFRLGQRVIVPRLLNPLLMAAMRVMPHRLLLPIVGWLLRPRG
jgi:uncharacterized protein